MTILTDEEDIKKIRESGKILARILRLLKEEAVPGVSTGYLDSLAEKLSLKYRAKPSFKDYRGFPKALCASLNDEVVHGVPSSARILKEGDVLTLDFGILYPNRGGFYTDSAITFVVGAAIKAPAETKRLISATRDALHLAISRIKAGISTSEIGGIIQNFIESQNFSVVRELAGHGVGRKVHDDPLIPNFSDGGKGIVLREGTVVAIEPMATTGSWRVRLAENGFTYKTLDHSLSAHFEHTVLVRRNRCEILTKA